MSEISAEGAFLELRQEPKTFGPCVDVTGQMSFQWHSAGWRYYWGEQGVHAGDVLEMLLADGLWQPVRFEWDYQADTNPILFTQEEVGFALPENARFRWPHHEGK